MDANVAKIVRSRNLGLVLGAVIFNHAPCWGVWLRLVTLGPYGTALFAR